MQSSGPPKKKKLPRWARALIAFLLSLIFPGLGQLFNRQPPKGCVMALSFLAWRILFGIPGLHQTFSAFLFYIVPALAWGLWISGDAAYRGWKGGAEGKLFARQWVKVTMLAVLILSCSILPATDTFIQKYWGIKAFRVPSNSMCPSVCEGDRVIADMNTFRRREVQRGDVVMASAPSVEALFIKRVIGVGGDTVSGTARAILVNNKPTEYRHSAIACGGELGGLKFTEETRLFGPVHVPQGSVFLLGDDLDNSYDSRYYGSVRVDQVRGRPLFLYWSWTRSRIGCAIE